ncbi:MAG: HD domain-containing protein, partial [Lactobacillus crispatus]|nr:HD domain-containing protein [Lactobacillus crispatus]
MTKLIFKNTYSPFSSEQIVAKEKANMKKKR